MFVQQWVSGRFVSMHHCGCDPECRGALAIPLRRRRNSRRSQRASALPSRALPFSPHRRHLGRARLSVWSSWRKRRSRDDLELRAPDGAVAAKAPGRRGGPPYFWMADVAEPIAGAWQAKLSLAVEKAGCKALVHAVTVRRAAAGGPGASAKSVWPIRAAWNRETENLYSAWIEALFDAPIDASPSWAALHEVLRDPARNVLFNHLGLGEDERGLVIKPDCADLPYFLRGYFAFKLGLPFGYSKCTRGSKGKPPAVCELVDDREPGAATQIRRRARSVGVVRWVFRQHSREAKSETARIGHRGLAPISPRRWRMRCIQDQVVRPRHQITRTTIPCR